MRYTQNINLPIVEDNDLYSKEINNLAFEKIDEEIQGLADIVETLDSPENSIADVKRDIRDINEQLDTINNNLNEMEIHKNSKATLVYFCDNAWRQTIDFFTNLVELGKKAGFTEINILIHINSDGTIAEDLTKFPQYTQIAKEKGVPITSLKVHGSYTSTNYVQNIYDTLDLLPEIDTVFIFNEQFNSVYSNGLTLPNQIKLKYPNIKKVGCTVDYATAFKNYNPSVIDEYKSIQENYDILGVHMYPSCGSYDGSKNTTYEQCLISFNDFELLIPWEKEIWVTESGVLPFWQFLELPESYNLDLLTDKNRTIEPQIIFYKALFNCNMYSKAKKIIPWYTESWVYDDTIKIWDYLKNIIVGQ